VKLIYERSQPGRRGIAVPQPDLPVPTVPASVARKTPPRLPELAEPEVLRHFTELSTRNFGIDTGFYPLGSCTMKYNPKRHERLAALAGIADLHPLQSDASCQGMLELLWNMQNILAEIAGLDVVSLQPAAGAHGELTALLVASAYFHDRGEKRTRVLIPDSAHGTNPSSAAIAGFEAVTIKSTNHGLVDLEDLRSHLDDRTAVFMITNPNTLGLFEKRIGAITKLLHEHGALVYLDGANMNAILGITRPGDFGSK
jgi:glycine dehydrogenase subunit 2